MTALFSQSLAFLKLYLDAATSPSLYCSKAKPNWSLATCKYVLSLLVCSSASIGYIDSDISMMAITEIGQCFTLFMNNPENNY